MKVVQSAKIKSLFIVLWVSIYFILSAIWADSQTSSIPTDTARELRAQKLSDGFSISLSWKPPTEDGEIIIARSNEVLDTPEKLYYADSLGRFPSSAKNPMNSFLDVNLRPGKYYYAIVMVKRVKEKNVVLWKEENYTSIPVETGIAENSTPAVNPSPAIEINSNYSISGIQVKHFKGYNQIHWNLPQNYDPKKGVLNLYRSREPMSTQSLLINSKKIIELNGTEIMYTDKDVDTSIPYYYGVSVSIDGKEYLPLIEGVSFARSFVPKGGTEFVENKTENKVETNPHKEKEDTKSVENKVVDRMHVENLNYEIVGDGIQLFWEPAPQAIANATIYTIYQSSVPIKNLHKSIEAGKAIKLAEVVHPELNYLIPKLERKRILYFAVTTKDEKGVEHFVVVEDESIVKVTPGQEKNTTIVLEKDKKEPDKKNETLEKEDKKDPTKEEETEKNSPPSLEFERIMADYYRKGFYSKAKDKFLELAFVESNKEMKAKCLFYSALSSYNLARYDDALKILLKDDLRKNYDKKRVDFYINQCIEKRSY